MKTGLESFRDNRLLHHSGRLAGGAELDAHLPWLATEHGANGVDLLIAQRGEVGQRAFSDARAIAVGLAQQERGAGRAVRHDVDVHGRMLQQSHVKSKELHGYIFQSESLR